MTQFVVELLNNIGNEREFVVVNFSVKKDYDGSIKISATPTGHYWLNVPSTFQEDYSLRKEEMSLRIHIGKENARGEFCGYIVLPEKLRGKGLGSFLMSKIIEQTLLMTGDKPVKIAGLNIHGDDDGGLRMGFYRRLGVNLKEQQDDRKAWGEIDDLRDLNIEYNRSKVREFPVNVFFPTIMREQSDLVRRYNEAADSIATIIDYADRNRFNRWRHKKVFNYLKYRRPVQIDDDCILAFPAQ